KVIVVEPTLTVKVPPSGRLANVPLLAAPPWLLKPSNAVPALGTTEEVTASFPARATVPDVLTILPTRGTPEPLPMCSANLAVDACVRLRGPLRMRPALRRRLRCLTGAAEVVKAWWPGGLTLPPAAIVVRLLRLVKVELGPLSVTRAWDPIVVMPPAEVMSRF